jgi:hypothetical protein
MCVLIKLQLYYTCYYTEIKGAPIFAVEYNFDTGSRGHTLHVNQHTASAESSGQSDNCVAVNTAIAVRVSKQKFRNSDLRFLPKVSFNLYYMLTL